jgi:hypothetical protein
MLGASEVLSKRLREEKIAQNRSEGFAVACDVVWATGRKFSNQVVLA